MKPSKLNEVEKQMESLVYKVHYANHIFKPSIGYTNARMNSLCGTIYKIYINNTDPELVPFLYVHECGHIIFAHTKNMNMRMDKFLMAKIQAAYSKIANLFPNYDKYLNIFKTTVFNIVMDFEVNSRLFTKEEWEFMNFRSGILLKDSSVRGMWPEEYGYPCGLTWNEYLNLVLQNPEEFLKHFRKNSLNNQESDFDGNLTQEEFEEYKEKVKKMSKEEMDKMEEFAENHEKATFSIPNGQMSGRTVGDAKPVNIDFQTFNSKRELINQIMKILHIKNTATSKRDILFNYNRRKHNSGVIIPKTIKNERITNKKLHILIDVSGSIDSTMVSDFVHSFYEVKQHFKKTQITTWNTTLVAQWKIEEPVINKYGGGTNIASGIKYLARTEKLKSNDVLFVISDFVDELAGWQRELQKINCKKYAINWKKSGSSLKGTSFNPGFDKILVESV